MKRHHWLGVIVGLGLALFWIIQVIRRVPDPVCQGRSLSQWIRDLRWGGGQQSDQAAAAIQSLGTNALPKLLQIIQSRKPGLREGLLNWGARHGLARYFRINVVDLHYQSVMAFKCLGKQAVPAVPKISSMLKRGINPGYASTALAMLGETGRRELIRYFNHPNLAVRRCSAAAFSTVKDQAELQLPQLIQACPTADAYGRSVVAEALGWHTNQPALTLPVLLGLVYDPTMEVRRAAVNSLSAYGAQASNALPVLREMVKGPPTDLTLPALNALNKIEGPATNPTDKR